MKFASRKAGEKAIKNWMEVKFKVEKSVSRNPTTAESHRG